MTNKEKYPKTEDAMKAFGEYELGHWNTMGFRTWLECEAESNKVPESKPADKNGNPSTPRKGNADPSLAGGMMGLAALIAPLLAGGAGRNKIECGGDTCGGESIHVRIDVERTTGKRAENARES